jgi:methionine-rich copper-binding protein CopC
MPSTFPETMVGAAQRLADGVMGGARAIAVAVAALILGAASFGTAQAQEMYDTSVPTGGDVLQAAPSPMIINFLEGIQVTKIRLLDKGGTDWPLEWVPTDDDVFKVEFRSAKSLPPGNYEILWWANVRQHYHPDGGVIAFTIAGEGQGGAGASLTPAAAPQAGGAPRTAPGWPIPTPRAGGGPRPDR